MNFHHFWNIKTVLLNLLLGQNFAHAKIFTYLSQSLWIFAKSITSRIGNNAKVSAGLDQNYRFFPIALFKAQKQIRWNSLYISTFVNEILWFAFWIGLNLRKWQMDVLTKAWTDRQTDRRGSWNLDVINLKLSISFEY